MKKFITALICIFIVIKIDTAQAQVNLSFSVERGFYETSFPISIQASDPTATIRYTTNGSAPTATNGTIYSTPLNISTTTILRATAILGGQASKVVTHSYIFIDDVVNQPNTLPAYPDNTAMGFHSSVKNHATYGSQITTALRELPSVSIAMQASHFVDMTTTKGNQHPVSIELLFQDGTPHYWQNGGVESYGNSSFNNQVKKNFRFFFKAEFEETKYDYPLFGPDGAEDFDYWVLRAGGQETTNRNGVQNLNDQFVRDLQLKTSGSAARGDFYHVYLNGIYWGVYNAAERPQKSFGESYFGGNKDDWTTLKATCCNTTLLPIDGTKDTWNSMIAAAAANDYPAVQDYLEVDHFIDYVMVNNFGPHGDWRTWNSYIIDNPSAGQKFRFYVWDVEPSLLSDRYYTNLTVNTRDYEDLWQPLKANADFRMRVADRMQCNCIEDDGPMNPQNTTTAYQALADKASLAYLAEIGRWSQAYVYDDFQQYLLDQVNIYLPGRTATLINTYKNHNLYPDIAAVDFSQDGGQIPANFNLTLTNPNGGGTIYYTTDGADPRALGGGIAATAQTYAGPINLDGVVTVRARVKSGSTWSAMCPRTFFGPQDLSALVINELNYNSTVTCGGEVEFLELYNRGTTSLNLNHCYFKEGIDFVFPEGTILAPDDYFVLTDDMGLFSAHYGFEADGQYGGSLSGKGELLLILDPLGMFVDSVEYDDKFPWPESPDGDGPSLELTDPDLDNAFFQNWHPSIADCGTPGGANSDPCSLSPPSLVINEINYKSLATFDSGDWVEIYNPTAMNVDLSAWQIQDEGNGFELAVGTVLSAGGYLVLVENDSLFSLIHPTVTNKIGDLGFGFSSGGEAVRLVSKEGCPVDLVQYDPAAPWPIAPSGEGPTLSLNDPATDNSLPTSWAASGNATGTPGSANTANCLDDSFIVINEINYNSPTTQNVGDWLELHNTSTQAIDLSGWQLHDAVSVFDLPPGTMLAADGYLLLLRNEAAFTAHYPTVDNYIVSTNLNLSNGGEDLRLFDSGRCLIDFVPYDDKAPWPTEPDGTGPTLSLITPDLDNEFPASWEASSANGTPGRENVPCPSAHFATAQTSLCVGAPVAFAVADNRSGVTYTWSFSTGNPSTAIGYTANTIWNSSGEKTVQLISTYYECSDTVSQTLTVLNCNNTPEANDDSFIIDEDKVLNDNVLTNDTDPDLDALTLNTTPIIAPQNGNLSLQANGNFAYTPNQHFNGNDSFRYKMCDTGTPVLCAEANVFVTIQAINDAPIAVADQINTAEDTEVIIPILANDTDVDGTLDLGSIQLSGGLPVSQGTLTINSDGTLTFLPALNYSGTVDAVTYSVCDTGTPLPAQCATGSLQITVTSENDPPYAADDVFTTMEDNPLMANVLTNDSDLDGDNLLASEILLAMPNAGTVTLLSDGDFTYTPNADFYGNDAFTYQICDNGTPQLCNQATVSLTITAVNDEPLLADDLATTLEETPINIFILNNDADPDGNLSINSLTLTSTPPTAEGTTTLNSDGSLTFIPAADYYGSVADFTYEICDDGIPAPVICSEATISITVTNENDAPIAVDDVLTAIEDQVGTGNVLPNDYDIENNALSANEILAAEPSNGTVAMEASGAYSYTPNQGFSGEDSFRYEVCDDGLPSLCAAGTVVVTVLPCPEVIPMIPTAICAGSSVIFSAEDQGAAAVYSWSFGADASPATSTNLTEELAYATGGAKDITLSITKNGCTKSTTISIVVGQAGFAEAGNPATLCLGEATQLGGFPTGPAGASFLWTPATGLNNATVANPFAAPDSTTTYQVAVQYGNCLISDSVTIVVENSPLFADAGLDIQDCGEGVKIGGAPSGPAGATYAWVPTAGLDDPTAANPTASWPSNRTYTLTVTKNGCSTSDEVTVGRRYPPIFSAGQDQQLCLDPSSQGVILGGLNNFPIYTYTWSPTIGLSHPNEGNTFANPPTTTIYTLSVTDGTCTASEEVIVYVDLCNDAPTAMPDLDSLEMNTSISGNLIANDYDVNGDLFAMDILPDIAPNHGSLSLSSNGDYTYVPAADFIGEDAFVYNLCDDGIPQFCARGNVRILVQEPRCIDVELYVLLEGAMGVDTVLMKTDLNVGRGLLPGQTPTNPLVAPTPAGQPYEGPPWSYEGIEGANFTDVAYSEEVVDWVLVSFRTATTVDSEVAKVAALLLKDGRVDFLDPCFLTTLPDEAVYIVVEHRHHLGIMSPTLVPLVDRVLRHDFRQEDSYRLAAGYGQLQLPNGWWCMFTGDGQQASDQNSYDINGEDKALFSGDNGNFDGYRPSDFNMDGNVDGQDNVLRSKNNGVTSRVPR